MKEAALFSKDDYLFLKYNVMDIPAKNDLVQSIKDFKDNPEFNVDIIFRERKDVERFELHPVDKNCAIRYMVLIFDPESPVQKKIPEYTKARQVAAVLAGFKTDKQGNFPKAVTQMMAGRISSFNEMLVRYIRLFHNPTFSLLVSTQESFYKKLLMMNDYSDINTGKKSAIDNEVLRGELHKQADNLLKQIDIYKSKLLNGDKNPYMQESLFQVVDEEAKRLNIRPEEQARDYAVLNNKVDPMDDD